MSDDENFPLATDRPQAQARQVEAEFNENQENIQNVENQENNVENESTVKTFESKTKLKVHFKGWNAVAFWKWIANDETCGICRVALPIMSMDYTTGNGQMILTFEFRHNQGMAIVSNTI